MSKSEGTAVALGIALVGVICLAFGIFIGTVGMRYEAVAYGHAEWKYVIDGQTFYQWRWK